MEREEKKELGCIHGRGVGVPCPHCMGINQSPQETTPEWEKRFDEFRHNIPVKLVDYEGNWNDITPALKSFIQKEKTASYHEALEEVKEMLSPAINAWISTDKDGSEYISEEGIIALKDHLVFRLKDLKK